MFSLIIIKNLKSLAVLSLLIKEFLISLKKSVQLRNFTLNHFARGKNQGITFKYLLY